MSTLTTKTVRVEALARVEGEGAFYVKVIEGKVEDAQLRIYEPPRFFEAFLRGRSYAEAPDITARICGICPVSHLMASAKAGDAILGIHIPPTAAKLRRLMNWAQIVQSHALSFFHLSGPDLLLGMDSDPAKRNLMGLVEKYPDVARNGIRLRRFGQKVIEILGGRSVHPAWVVPGGVREPLSDENRSKIRRMLPEAFDIVGLALDMLKDSFEHFRDEEAVDDVLCGHRGAEAAEHLEGAVRGVADQGSLLPEPLKKAREQGHNCVPSLGIVREKDEAL